MTRLRALPAAAAALALATLTACGGTAGAGDDRSDIAASFYPLAWTAERVAGEQHTVRNLTSPGGEPHDLELSIRETAAISEADLVVFESGFQPVVDEAVADAAQGEVLDVVDVVELAVDGEGHEADDGHDHADDAEAEAMEDLETKILASLGVANPYSA